MSSSWFLVTILVVGAISVESAPPSQCTHYKTLPENDRANKRIFDAVCDWDIQDGWYRFKSSDGKLTSMWHGNPTPMGHCATHATGWLQSAAPSKLHQTVHAKVCYHWAGDTCLWKNNVQVTNCGKFYVYYLKKTPTCMLRYCAGNKVPPPQPKAPRLGGMAVPVYTALLRKEVRKIASFELAGSEKRRIKANRRSAEIEIKTALANFKIPEDDCEEGQGQGEGEDGDDEGCCGCCFDCDGDEGEGEGNCPDGGSSDLGDAKNPAPSCNEIHKARPELPSGKYYLKIGGNVYRAYCNMDLKGGGWTRVINIHAGSKAHHNARANKPALIGNDNNDAKLSDADINLIPRELAYFYYRCHTGKWFAKNNANKWTSNLNNNYQWHIDQQLDGSSFECRATRKGMGFSGYPHCAAGHSNYGYHSINGCYRGSWSRPGAVYVK